MFLFRQNYVVRQLKNCRRSISSTTRVIIKDNLPAAAYKPEFVERNKYMKWESEGRFRAENSSSKANFSMVLPPPNVTGKLHLGHALACTIQDVIVRRQRSLRENVLWLPGIDHAGIATQGVVEKYLKSTTNKSRHDIGREKFVMEVWKWKERHGETICDQLRNLGCSLDWSRRVFTMDAHHTRAVNTAFINLFDKGLIYRKKALVNWCRALKSTVSDIEVEHKEIKGPTDMNLPYYDKPVKFGQMYEFAYKVFDSKEEVVVSTTLPETMLGDTAVAVHPDDERYKHLKGKRVIHPFMRKTLPIIFDDFVDMEFGTGAVKITPAHSKQDFDIAKDHHLPLHQVIDEEGRIQNTGKFDNMDKYECREMLLKQLEELGLLKKVVPHKMFLPTCSRTGDVIDYLPKEQWFLSCSSMNERAAELVETGKLRIQPEKFVRNWLEWTGEDRDWCVSRQLWWGHQIPAYRCSVDKDTVWVAAHDEKEAKTKAMKYLRSMPESIQTERDTDVLDTWFSSGIYPFAAMGWPEKDFQDFREFYPLNLMATGHDILGFWVQRMVILGLELTDRLPFENILLHGIICDNKGAKMSKSKGNVIDPMDVINGIKMQALKDKTEHMHKVGILTKEELQKALAYHKSNFANTHGIPDCGVDALRFTLLSQDIKSHFVNFDVAMCHANKLFCNKMWQSLRYMQIVFGKLKLTNDVIMKEDLTCFDRWILSRLANMVEVVNKSMDNYEFHIATRAIKGHIYNEFCDVYLEATKPGFESEDVKVCYAHAHTLSAVLSTSLRCLAPFMIYVTDELIPKVPAFQHNIIHNFDDLNEKHYRFPETKDFEIWKDEGTEKRVEKLLDCISLVRELKGIYNISNKFRPHIIILSDDKDLLEDIEMNKYVVTNLTRCKSISFSNDESRRYVTGVIDTKTQVFVEMLGEDIDSAIQSAKTTIEKRVKKLEDTLAKMEAKMTNNNYISNVPEWTQVMEREKLQTKKKQLEELQRLI